MTLDSRVLPFLSIDTCFWLQHQKGAGGQWGWGEKKMPVAMGLGSLDLREAIVGLIGSHQ